MNRINPVVAGLEEYLTKAISMRAASLTDVVDLSFGLPAFGPPEILLEALGQDMLSPANFIEGLKRYEAPRGNLELRNRIAQWYERRYGLCFDPDTEILVTHGGVEAITLAILTLTQGNRGIGLFSPTYMLYNHTVSVLGRHSFALQRPCGGNEYERALSSNEVPALDALIVNSPENPSGYVISDADLDALNRYAEVNDAWVLHDEVYDSMTWGRRHVPIPAHGTLRDRSVLINSCSKKFGMPGLRIGWLVGPKAVIDAAARVHDYLYLGVCIHSEQVAELILGYSEIDSWLATHTDDLCQRASFAMNTLDATKGFLWPRHPHGAMFLFPDVSGLASALGHCRSSASQSAGERVATHLLEHHCVAVTPGAVYGDNCRDHVRIVLSADQSSFEKGISRMSQAYPQEAH